MTYTILQASFFVETWLTGAVGFDWPSGAVRVYGDGNQKVAFVAAKDIVRNSDRPEVTLGPRQTRVHT